MSDLPKLELLKPVARCGECHRKLYNHTMPCNRDECPMRGEEWMKRHQLYRMQNTWVKSPPIQTPEETKE